MRARTQARLRPGKEEVMAIVIPSEHVIEQREVRDIDRSLVWTYAECSCGWESPCVRDASKSRDAANAHVALFAKATECTHEGSEYENGGRCHRCGEHV